MQENTEIQENKEMQEDREMQKGKELKREFQWARKIIVVVTAIVFLFLLCDSFGNGILELIPLACVFAGVAWIACFICTGLSRRMIQIGDRISNKALKVLYYAVLLPLVLVVWLGIYCLILYIDEKTVKDCENSWDALGDAIIVLFWGAVFLVVLLVPYVQSLLVLLMHKILKNKSEEEAAEKE